MVRDANILRKLAVSELQTLLRFEPQLEKAFKRLALKAHHPRLKTFCQEGVSYTNRRIERVRAALNALEGGQISRPSSGLAGLINDALKAARLRDRKQRDCAILAAVQRISHYGLITPRSIGICALSVQLKPDA